MTFQISLLKGEMADLKNDFLLIKAIYHFSEQSDTAV
jgi:hypothetical protein